MVSAASCTVAGLDFKLTCAAMPEQYDVYQDDVQVAYVRLRNGWLYVSDPSMNDIWWEIDDTDDADPPLRGDGEFETSTERCYFLNKIADVINKKLEHDNAKDNPLARHLSR